MIRAATSTARPLGTVSGGCGGAGNWDSINIESERICRCMCKQSKINVVSCVTTRAGVTRASD